MLCYVMLCYAMLSDVILCYVMVRHVMIRWVLSGSALPSYVMLCECVSCYVRWALLRHAALHYVLFCHVMLCYAICYALPCKILQRSATHDPYVYKDTNMIEPSMCYLQFLGSSQMHERAKGCAREQTNTQPTYLTHTHKQSTGALWAWQMRAVHLQDLVRLPPTSSSLRDGCSEAKPQLNRQG